MSLYTRSLYSIDLNYRSENCRKHFELEIYQNGLVEDSDALVTLDLGTQRENSLNNWIRRLSFLITIRVNSNH